MALKTVHAEASSPAQVPVHRAIGALGVGLPVVLILASVSLTNDLPVSLSYAVWSPLRDLYVAAMAALSVLLVVLRTDGMGDTVARLLATVGALGSALVPVAPLRGATSADEVAGTAHLLFEALFFFSMAYLCLRTFDRFADYRRMGPRMWRVVVVRFVQWNGGPLIIALATMALPFVTTSPLHLGLWLESIASITFGFMWLIRVPSAEPEAHRTSHLADQVGLLADRVAQAVHESVPTALTEALHGAPLTNYQGWVSLDLVSDDGRAVSLSDFQELVFRPGAVALLVTIGRERTGAEAGELHISSGVDRSEVEFGVEVDSDYPAFRRSRKTIAVRSRGASTESESFPLYFSAQRELPAWLWVRVSQGRRVVQTVQVALSTSDRP